MVFPLKTILPILLCLLYTAALLYAGTLSKKLNFSVSTNTYISGQFNYQLLALAIAAVSIVSSYYLNKENFTRFFSFGNISAPAAELKAFGIKQGDTWLKTGLSLSIVITIATSLFMYFQLKGTAINWSQLSGALFWIVLFSISNSFVEEMIFRIGIISPLSGSMAPGTLFLISAIAFGLPHFAGMPSGLIGASMAGLLGYVLAKSMVETSGFFWAWFIHFIQDVVIIGSLYLIKTSAAS